MARSLAQRVASGAKMLDKKAPGWEKKVKRTKLQMESNEMCVLGQLGNGDAWAFSLGTLKISEDDHDKYGFTGESTEEGKPTHEELWAEEIKSRLSGVEAAEKKTPAKAKIKDK